MKIFLKNYMYNIRIKNVIVFACIGLLTSYIASAAVRTTSGTGNWSSVGTWGGASVPNSTDNVNVNHGLNLNSDLTILLSGIYNFNASNTGGTPNVTLGSWPISGGDLNINSPSYITLGTVSANNGTIHIYSGATLNITGSLAILGTQIIIDAGGTLIVGGNFTNTNGNITNNGDITVAASYTGYNTFLQTTDVTGTGSFTTGGSMTNDSGFLIPSSTIYGSTNDCNTGPCNAACLSGMTTGAISGPSTICSGATGIVFSTPAVSGGVNFTWTLPAGTVITGGAGTRTITVTAGATAGNVTVKASNISCSSSNTSTYAVRVGKPTGTAAIAGPTNSCQNVSGITYTVSGVSGASSYSWTVPLGATITSGTGTSSITVTMGTTSGIVQVVPSNICGNATGSTIGSVNVTLNPAPTAMISYSSNSYCKNTTTVQIPAFTGTTGGTFSSSPSGLNLNSSTGAITPSLSTNNKTYTITYTVTGSGCTTATATASVGIKNSSLNSPTAITGAISVCPNESGMPYSISAVIDAASYSWGLPSGTVATSGVGSRSIIATLGTVSGTISVAPIKSDGCMGNTTTLWVDVSTNCTLIWTGTSSSDWGTTSNWSPAIIPASGDYISIPNVTRKPIITTGKTGNIKNIIIEPSSSITLNNGGALNVYGNITNNGIVTADDGSTINMLGATAQTITGVPVLYNVVINNTAGVSIASPLAVNGALSLKAGVLTTNNKLTINFDNGGNIAYNPSDAGSVVGSVTATRNLNYKTHYIAAPFAGVTSAQVQATTPLFVGKYWKMYTKDFAKQNWTAVITTTQSMPLGTGFSLSLPTAAPLNLSGTYTHGSTFNSEAYSNVGVEKYFMIGNPYPSTLDWDNGAGWTKTNIGGSIYYLNAATSQTASYVSGTATNGGTGYIPAMQSFMVLCDGTGGFASVGINSNARISLQNPSFWRVASEDIIRIHLTGENPVLTDEAVIRFNESATNMFDFDLDATKIMNGGKYPSVYTREGSSSYSINSYSRPDSAKVIPVLAKLVEDGTYTLRFENTNSSIQYVLIDNQLGVEQSITEPYTFVGTNKDSVDRFELQLRESAIPLTTGLHSANKARRLQINSSIKGFILQSDRFAGESADIELMDVTGNSVGTIANKSITSNRTFVPLDLPDGSYIVRVTIGSDVFTGLIVLVK